MLLIEQHINIEVLSGEVLEDCHSIDMRATLVVITYIYSLFQIFILLDRTLRKMYKQNKKALNLFNV